MHPALGTRGVVDSWFGRFAVRLIAKLSPNRGRDVEDLARRRHAKDGVDSVLNQVAKHGVVAGHESSDGFIGGMWTIVKNFAAAG
jgi:hypothetical protein